MIEYSTSKNCLQTKVHVGLLLIKYFFQVEYSFVGQILKTIYTGFGGNNIAKFIDYQILPDKFNIFITNLTVIFTIKKDVPTCFDFALWPLMLKVAKHKHYLWHTPRRGRCFHLDYK